MTTKEVDALLKEKKVKLKKGGETVGERRARLADPVENRPWSQVIDALQRSDAKAEKLRACITKAFEWVRLHTGVTHFPLGAANNPTALHEMLKTLALIESDGASDEITEQVTTAFKSLLAL